MNLQTVKQNLVEKRESLQLRLEKIEDDLSRKSGALSADLEEQATELENQEVLEELDVSIHATLEQIDTALNRIEAGTYGVCQECGNSIKQERLEAIPFTAHCIDCARNLQTVSAG